MKLILKDGAITLVDIYNPLVRVDTPVELDVKEVLDMGIHYLRYSFGGDFKDAVNNTITIPEDIGSQGVVITIKKCRIGSGRVIETFKSDELPVTKYVLLGKPVEDAYPKIITEMLYRLEKAESRIKELETSGDLI